MNLSFAGCGFLGIYHVGVAVCFKKYAPHLLLNKISGASAGAIAACALLCDLPLGKSSAVQSPLSHFPSLPGSSNIQVGDFLNRQAYLVPVRSDLRLVFGNVTAAQGSNPPRGTSSSD